MLNGKTGVIPEASRRLSGTQEPAQCGRPWVLALRAARCGRDDTKEKWDSYTRAIPSAVCSITAFIRASMSRVRSSGARSTRGSQRRGTTPRASIA